MIEELGVAKRHQELCQKLRRVLVVCAVVCLLAGIARVLVGNSEWQKPAAVAAAFAIGAAGAYDDGHRISSILMELHSGLPLSIMSDRATDIPLEEAQRTVEIVEIAEVDLAEWARARELSAKELKGIRVKRDWVAI
ncbi:MAG: hypothetical protein V3W34_09800 [Phycisphaerae bacterium]